jgi:hypothetical protein
MKYLIILILIFGLTFISSFIYKRTEKVDDHGHKIWK